MEDPSKTNKPDDVVQSSVWESPNKRWLEAARLCSYQSICSPLSTIWYWHRWVLNLTKTRCFYIFNFCHSFQWVPITLSTIPEVHYPCVHPLVTSFIWLNLFGPMCCTCTSSFIFDPWIIHMKRNQHSF